ncbi:MAG: RNA polymerase sigma factor [Gammaproteobacteria bacterium]|nr:RNA polymerase sigma factor [Gammaproteobacteria bacterium]
MVKSDAMSDERLIERSRNGDSQAFQLLVEKYEGMVAATVIGMLGRGPDAEDVGQETFIRFYGALDRFRGDSAVGTYLTRIAINQSLKAIKKRKGFLGRFASSDAEEIDLPDESVDVDRRYEARETHQLVQDALQRLGPDHRAVVVLRMLQEYSTQETARMLGLPAGTVMSRLSRALEKMQKLLAPVMTEGVKTGDEI